MTATFAILLIAALLMAGVIADSLWGAALAALIDYWGRAHWLALGWARYTPGLEGIGSEKKHYKAAKHRAGE
jgi:hypothetical protein